MDRVSQLKEEISNRERDLQRLRDELAEAIAADQNNKAQNAKDEQTTEPWSWPLQDFEYVRYSRQMIVPGFGVTGQQRIRTAKALIIGAGGLGCPAASYLVGAGVSVVGLVDGDTVETSNLHRQIAHATSRVGMFKVESAIQYLKQLNPTVTLRSHPTHLSNENAAEIVSDYDIVLDCTDHPASRYLVSDICVLLKKPLISASAFQTSGQLIVLNNPPGIGPCYRCVFPKPPPPESVLGCGEGGILGPVVGVMGVLQALEAIKVIIRGNLEEEKDTQATQSAPLSTDNNPRMLLFSAMDQTPFRTVRMRAKRDDCFACGKESRLTLKELQNSLDYVQFCGVVPPVRLLQPQDRISARHFSQSPDVSNRILLDVREKEHYGLCHLEGAVNIPISRFMSGKANAEEVKAWFPSSLSPTTPIYTICRVGNDSQIVAQKLKELGFDEEGQRLIGDIDGGYRAWKSAVDPTIPLI